MKITLKELPCIYSKYNHCRIFTNEDLFSKVGCFEDVLKHYNQFKDNYILYVKPECIKGFNDDLPFLTIRLDGDKE